MSDWEYLDITPWYKDSRIKNITINSGITTIGRSAFNNCTNLQSITIPTSVTRIGNNAFDSYTKMSSITIPYSVTSIYGWTFNNWTLSQRIYIKNQTSAPTGYVSTWNSGCNAIIYWNQ